MYDISFILNPLKFIEFDFKAGDIIFNKITKYENSAKYDSQVRKVYVDLSTGLLSKDETYEAGKLIQSSVFYDYEFNEVEDYEVFLSDVQKNEIIEGSNEK